MECLALHIFKEYILLKYCPKNIALSQKQHLLKFLNLILISADIEI